MNLLRKTLLPVQVALFAHLAVQAQPGGYSTRDTKAIKVYEEALECMHMRQWGCVESNLKKALKLDEAFIEPRYAMAEMYDMQGKDADAMAAYREALARSPKFYPMAYLHLAEIEFRNQQYIAAQQHYTDFIGMNEDPVREERARLGLESCTFAQEAVQHPVPFDPKNLGQGVNTATSEYYPCITADDRTLLFTRDVHDGTPPYGHQEDFVISDRDANGTWGNGRLVPNVDTKRNEGAGTLSPDGRFIIFTMCADVEGYGEGLKGYGSCDLFISRRIGDRWSPPDNLGPAVNSRNWETQPSLGSDGRTLYYVRGMQGADGIKSMDIFVSRLQDDGSWSRPERLGDNVNTPFQEESVQIHPDGRTLYFSSNGHPGMGGLDIFVSRLQPDGSWGPAQNLGYPINTGGDENSWLVNARGTEAFFASDRPGGFGELDLYSATIPERARPDPVSYIHGRVSDALSGAAIEADVELFDLATGDLATGAYSDPRTGEFLICVPAGRDYALNTSAEGYLFHSSNHSVKQSGMDAPLELSVPLSPIKSGQSIALRNIFFETARYDLLPASNAELNKLLKLMQGTPALRIEVGGHTDHVGDDASNQKLSEQRANAVRSFLIGKGIDGTRIVARGYGESKPVASNETEEGRALNRRTEITVL